MKMPMLLEAAQELESRAQRHLNHAEDLTRRTTVPANDKREMLARLDAMQDGIDQMRALVTDL